MFWLLLGGLVILAIINYFINKKEIVSPSFIFAFSFVFSSLWAAAYYDEWKLEDFNPRTTFVILGGVLIFSIVSLVFGRIGRLIKRKEHKEELINPKTIDVSKTAKWFCLVFSIITVLVCLYSIVKVTHFSFANISAAIAYYDRINKFSDKSLSIGRVPSIMRTISIAMAYWFLYILVNNYIAKKKIEWLYVWIILFGLLASMAMGGRNGAINVILSVPPTALLLMRGKMFRKEKKKAFRYIIIAGLALLVVFPKLTNILGRTTSASSEYYLAIYCGAEIKNLDSYIGEFDSTTSSQEKNNMTFIYINKWLGPKLGYASDYKFDLPFRTVGKYTLGNVYTTFYAFIYDYGYVGLVLLTCLMALISQLIYEKARAAIPGSSPNMAIMVYGYMFSSLVLSFFSNKFYEQNFNPTFLKMIICWLVFNWLFVSKKGQNRKTKDEEKIIA